MIWFWHIVLSTILIFIARFGYRHTYNWSWCSRKATDKWKCQRWLIWLTLIALITPILNIIAFIWLAGLWSVSLGEDIVYVYDNDSSKLDRTLYRVMKYLTEEI